MSRSRRLLALLLAVGAALFLVACGDEEETTSTAAGSAECEDVEAAEPKQVKLKRPSLDPLSAGTVATFETSCGPIEIELDSRRAPRTAASFAYLVEEGVYDGTGFHRVAPGFVIQGGDPAGDGGGGPGYSVVEAPPGALAYTKGVVAMAKTQTERPGTSGSQFFVVTAEDAQLPPDYALLGKVTKGQDVVDRIGVLPTTAEEQPAEPVVIRSVAVAQG